MGRSVRVFRSRTGNACDIRCSPQHGLFQNLARTTTPMAALFATHALGKATTARPLQRMILL
eukprot:15406580-Alexandrium_andersonii.AAC.1